MNKPLYFDDILETIDKHIKVAEEILSESRKGKDREYFSGGIDALEFLKIKLVEEYND